MGLWKTAAGMALAVLAYGCAPGAVTAVATVELEGATEADRRAAAGILEARLREFVGSYTASVTATPTATGVSLEFRGEPPPDETIRRYAGTRGVMRISPEKAPLIALVTDRDVESAQPYTRDVGPELAIVLSERAGQRMLEYTKRNLGRGLVTTWDGADPTIATISGAFGREFQTTGMDRATVMLRAVVLRSGRLPVPVKSVVVHHPAR